MNRMVPRGWKTSGPHPSKPPSERSSAPSGDGQTITIARYTVRRTRRAALYLIMVLLSAMAASPPALAQSRTLVRVHPVEIQVGPGSASAAEIRIDDVEGLYAFDIRLSFDATIVAVVDADPALEGIQVAPGSLLNLDFVVRNEADNAHGTVWLAMTQMNPSEAVSGSGTAFVVTLRGKEAGRATPLTITRVQLVTRHGEEIPAEIQDGQVVVVEAEKAPSPPTTAPAQQPSILTATPGPSSQSEPPASSPTATTAPHPTAPPASTSRPNPAAATSTPVSALGDERPEVTGNSLDAASSEFDASSNPTASRHGESGPQRMPEGGATTEHLSSSSAGMDLTGGASGASPLVGRPADPSSAGQRRERDAQSGSRQSGLFRGMLTVAALGALLVLSGLGSLLVRPARRRRGTPGSPGKEAR